MACRLDLIAEIAYKQNGIFPSVLSVSISELTSDLTGPPCSAWRD
jgi:hypothetical protein